MNKNVKNKIMKLDDLNIVLSALAEVNDTIEKGSRTKLRDSWKQHNAISTHYAHINCHLSSFKEAYGKENKLNKQSIESISHATARCLMILQIIIEESDNYKKYHRIVTSN